MKKITLLGANLDSGNMGVGALFMGAITTVKHTWTDAVISLLDYDDAPKTIECMNNGNPVKVDLVPMSFSKHVYRSNHIAMLLFMAMVLRICPFKSLNKRIIDNNNCLKHLNSSDMILSIAGGDSFSDIYGMERFLYVTLSILLVIIMKKNLLIMPQTIGPFKGFVARTISSFILKHSSIVYARDNESLVLAKKLMGAKHEGRAHFCYDMGFVLEPIRPTDTVFLNTIETDKNKPLVGLNISGLLCMGGYNKKNMFDLKVDYSQLIGAVVHYLIEVKKARVLLVPHVFGKFEESDETAIQRFFYNLSPRFGNDLIRTTRTFDQNRIKYIIGKCDFFIGSRMHACIAALSQGIPAVGIAYSRKFAGVMTSIGTEALIADPRIKSQKELLDLIGKAFDEKESWAALLKERMPHIRNTVMALLNDTRN